MTVPKFTPGPWQVMPLEAEKDYIRIRGTVLGGRWKVANVHFLTYEGLPEASMRTAAESAANALLIASAPRLAMTLHALVQGVQAHLSAFDLKHEVEAAKDALRAAGIDVRQPE